MRDNLPLSFWIFRTSWTVLHFLIVAAAIALILWWALSNHHAANIFESAKYDILRLQREVANAIPWPWKS